MMIAFIIVSGIVSCVAIISRACTIEERVKAKIIEQLAKQDAGINGDEMKQAVKLLTNGA